MTRHLLLISRCPPYPLYLGDRLIIWNLARELSARGWQIDLLAFTQFESDLKQQAAYADFFRTITLIPEGQRGKLDYLRRLLYPPARFPRHGAASWSPEMWQKIVEALASRHYDAVTLFGGIHVYEYFHTLKGRPTAIIPYESYSLLLRRQREQQPFHPILLLQEQIARWYERFMFAPYAQTVVISPVDRDILLKLNPKLNIEVIPTGIDLDNFQPMNLPRQANRLLFVGNYEYGPNADAAIVLARDILPQVRQTIPDVRLWIVGNAPPPELMALNSEFVEVTGRVPDVRPYYAQATLFACPLRWGAGVKFKMLEALTMGLPVVATPLSVDGIATKEHPAALTAEIDTFAAAVIRLLQDAALQKHLAEDGCRLIEASYSWSQIASRYESLWAALD